MPVREKLQIGISNFTTAEDRIRRVGPAMVSRKVG